MLLALSGTAAAQPLWRAQADCPDADDVRARVERRLGGPLDATGISIGVTRADDGFVATIDTGDVRTLTSARCDELADAVAVIVARVASERRSPIEPVATPPAVTAHWTAGARLSTIGGLGVVPAVGVAGELAAYVRRDRAMLELGRARWLAGSTGGVDVGLGATTARVGWVGPLRGWLVGELGSATGVRVATGDTGSSRWLAAGAGAGAGWHVADRVSLVGAVEVVAAIERARFELPGGTTAYEAPRVSARTSLGLEIGW